MSVQASSLKHSEAALAVYEARRAAINQAFFSALDALPAGGDNQKAADLALAECERAEQEALRTLREAFHRDTAHVNSLDRCMHVCASDVRRLVRSWREQQRGGASGYALQARAAGRGKAV